MRAVFRDFVGGATQTRKLFAGFLFRICYEETLKAELSYISINFSAAKVWHISSSVFAVGFGNVKGFGKAEFF